MYELNGYGEEPQLNGFFKRIRKRLKKVVKSKAFKIVAIAAAATGIGMFAGPAIMALGKKAAFKGVASKLRKKVRKAGKGVINKRLLAGKRPPPNPKLNTAVKREALKIRQLPVNQREAALVNNPVLAANAQRRVQYQVQPYFQQQYQRQGYPQRQAVRMANRDAVVTAKETVKDIQKTTAPSNIIPLVGIAATMLMLKG